MTDKTTAILEDCRLGMRNYPDKYFQLLEADPPYFHGPNTRQYYGPKINKLNIKRVEYPVIQTWELPDVCWFNEAQAVSENQIIWGANYFDFIEEPHPTPRPKDLAAWIEKHPIGWIVWDKCNYDSSFNSYELAWTSFNLPTVIFTYMWNGMMQGKNISEGSVMQGNKSLNEKRIHPTQKPVNLYKWQFKTFCKPGDKIISTHLGSGSARIAAYKLGYDFTGFETDLQVYQKQEKRFHQHISQLQLFTI